MAQHASPKVMGHMLDSRAQLMPCSRVVAMTPSSNRPSNQPIYATPALSGLESDLAYSGEFPGSCIRRRRRWARNGCFRRRAPDPIQVAAFPEIGKADQQNAEEHQNIPEGDPGQAAGRLLGNYRLCRGNVA